jgi:predicted alpha/beta hydrolase family esterase
MAPTLLIVPGWKNSGPQHWQSIWQNKRLNARRVEQYDWDTPQRADWVMELDREVSATTAPIMLIAHSLGCITIAHWARSASRRTIDKVAGAMLVAPADIERPDGNEELRNFASIPLEPLPFDSLLVASSNDPYCTAKRARRFADAWGSEYYDIGPAGHINTETGYGDWPEGEQLLSSFMERTAAINLIAES